MDPPAFSKLSSTKLLGLWKRSYGRSLGSKCIELKSKKCIFLIHVKPSTRKGAKFLSNDSVCKRFCFQALNEVIVSDFDRDHCLGARIVAIVSIQFNATMLQSPFNQLMRKLCHLKVKITLYRLFVY